VREIHTTHHIDKSDEGRYYTVGFDVPEGAQTVRVSYRYAGQWRKLFTKKSERNIVDLGLMDGEGNFLGWSGSSRGSVYVGQNASTPGYLSYDIAPGRWSIIVGAYKIAMHGVDVHYDISFEREKPRLMFGDMHMHSQASDGRYSKCELAKRAKKRGLDFIAVSDHNNFAENFALPHNCGVTFIPAVEWTHYRGHVNMYGACNPFRNSFIANTPEEAAQVIAQAKSTGALISANHPKCSLCPYLFGDEMLDIVEIWNGPMRPANIRALKWWTSLLRQGRKIPITGGSDFHKPHPFIRMGHPVTAVVSASTEARDILSEIAKGHAYVTCSSRGPRLSVACNDAIMGDTVKSTVNQQLKITAERLKFDSLVLVCDKYEKRLTSPKFGKAEATFEVQDISFAYVKAVKRIFGFEFVRAVSNPVYFER
jgi:hypothetical protein